MANGTLLSLLPDKPIYKSLTCWGVAVVLGAQAVSVEACASGVIGATVCATLTKVFTYIGGAMAVLGLRRSSGAAVSG